MDTYFAPSTFTEENELNNEIDLFSHNPVTRGLLKMLNGMTAVLDENRQVIALNDSFLTFIGMDHGSDVLGLRLGEILKCPHSNGAAGGCGTAKPCSNCGAAITIVSSLLDGSAHERTCSIRATINGITQDLFLWVKCSPLPIAGKNYILLFIRDITAEQRQSSLERTFFHDVNNILAGLISGAELLSMGGDNQDSMIEMIRLATLRLKKEIDIQNKLSISKASIYKPAIEMTSIAHILEELESNYTNHPATIGKEFKIAPSLFGRRFRTDISLLIRVVSNMVTNALEATDGSRPVQLWVETEPDQLIFCVHNAEHIPNKLQSRIFERNFSTKSGIGRGTGTYSMKLFGEQVLGGKVSFTTSFKTGTVFRLTLPT